MDDATATAANPLTSGFGDSLEPQPCTLVIFGGSGDLTRRKLLPALYNLQLDGVLPASFAVLGFARSELDDAEFRTWARTGVEEFSRRPIEDDDWSDFARRLYFLAGSFGDEATAKRLLARLGEIESAHGVPANRVFYLAIPPSLIRKCVAQLSDRKSVV